MIDDKFVDLYARNSGLQDKLIAERDVVLTYALRGLHESGVLDHLAFKGGTCLRKTVFGSGGRFSEDLDFTLDTDRPEDDVLLEIVDAFNRDYHGVRFTFDDYYKTDEGTSFGGQVLYRHSWNENGRFELQVSLRERPTLPVASTTMLAQAYFTYLEFEMLDVPSLQPIEMIAEKVRAAYQRVKVRDLYDLHCFGDKPFDADLLRRLVVLKLWQVKDPFDPDSFFAKLESGVYDWDDLERLIRSTSRIDRGELLATVRFRYAALCDLSELERQVIADSKSGWNEPLADRLRSDILSRFEA